MKRAHIHLRPPSRRGQVEPRQQPRLRAPIGRAQGTRHRGRHPSARAPRHPTIQVPLLGRSDGATSCATDRRGGQRGDSAPMIGAVSEGSARAGASSAGVGTMVCSARPASAGRMAGPRLETDGASHCWTARKGGRVRTWSGGLVSAVVPTSAGAGERDAGGNGDCQASARTVTHPSAIANSTISGSPRRRGGFMACTRRVDAQWPRRSRDGRCGESCPTAARSRAASPRSRVARVGRP